MGLCNLMVGYGFGLGVSRVCGLEMCARFPLWNFWFCGMLCVVSMFLYGFGLCVGWLVWAHGLILLDGWLYLSASCLQSLRCRHVWQFSPLKCLAGWCVWFSLVFCYGLGLCFGCSVWAHVFIPLDFCLWLWVWGLQGLRGKHDWLLSPLTLLAGWGCLALIRVLLWLWLVFWLSGCWLQAAGCWLLAAGFCVGCWLLLAGCWLLFVD